VTLWSILSWVGLADTAAGNSIGVSSVPSRIVILSECSFSEMDDSGMPFGWVKVGGGDVVMNGSGFSGGESDAGVCCS
jgi:hypothetical protein